MDHIAFTSIIKVIFYIFGGLYYSILFCLVFFLIYDDDFKLLMYYLFIGATIAISMVFGIAEIVNANSIENIYNSIAYISYTISTSIITIWLIKLLAKYNDDSCK